MSVKTVSFGFFQFHTKLDAMLTPITTASSLTSNLTWVWWKTEKYYNYTISLYIIFFFYIPNVFNWILVNSKHSGNLRVNSWFLSETHLIERKNENRPFKKAKKKLRISSVTISEKETDWAFFIVDYMFDNCESS